MDSVITLAAALLSYPYGPVPVPAGRFPGCHAGILRFQLASGALPEGIRLTPGGYLQGVAATAGRHAFTVHVENGCASRYVPVVLPVVGAPVLEAWPLRVALDASAPSQAQIQVSANVPGVPYTITSDASWLAVRPLRGRTPEAGAALVVDPVSLEPDLDALLPGTHTARLQITAWRAATSPEVVVTVTVPPPYVQ